MSELWSAYWPAVLLAVLIGLIVGYLIFRPRQRIRLSDNAPIRPHMTRLPRAEGRGVADEPAAAVSDVTGGLIGSNVQGQLTGAGGAPDQLTQMKGVGPKLAAMLNAHGLTRFDQIAGLSPGQVEAIDASLGAFRGRFARDRIVEQAHYLARSDLDGYRSRFGAL